MQVKCLPCAIISWPILEPFLYYISGFPVLYWSNLPGFPVFLLSPIFRLDFLPLYARMSCYYPLPPYSLVFWAIELLSTYYCLLLCSWRGLGEYKWYRIESQVSWRVPTYPHRFLILTSRYDITITFLSLCSLFSCSCKAGMWFAIATWYICHLVCPLSLLLFMLQKEIPLWLGEYSG